MKTTTHDDGTVSLRLTRDELRTLEASTLYGMTHWQAKVFGEQTDTPGIDRAILDEHIRLYDEMHAFMERLRQS